MSRIVTVGTASEVRELVGGWHGVHETVALVPTMGNLHDGHLSLVRLARKVADRVVVSIFVNPTQFGVGEDFADYPRTLDDDRGRLADEGGVDALFVPAEQEVYPFGTERAVRFVMPALARDLCGASRPGHFDGVASVVCRLLNIVQPDALVLGRKDYQQCVLIRHLVADLCMPVHIVTGATRRETDGVAMSSRNRYLDAAQRRRAPALHETLERVREALRGGEADYARLEREALGTLERAGFAPDYVQIRRSADLAKPDSGGTPDELIVLGAARLGPARLIDNTSR